MAPIRHVGYLRRVGGPDDSSLAFAVLWNEELTLFPCQDASQQYIDPTAEVYANPQVFNIKGASAFVTQCVENNKHPGLFNLIGHKSSWKAQLTAGSREEAVIWVARILSCSSGCKPRPSSFESRVDLIQKEIDAIVSESPNADCADVTSIVNWMKRVKKQDAEEIVVGATAPSTPRRTMAYKRLTCLKEQLKEREYLLKQLEAQEKQFLGSEKQEYHPCRFTTTAKTSFCLLNGNDSTEVRSGDKIVVYGLKEDYTWRCCVDRTVSVVMSCGCTGLPGCDAAQCCLAARATADTQQSVVVESSMLEPSAISTSLVGETLSEEGDSLTSEAAALGQAPGSKLPPAKPKRPKIEQKTLKSTVSVCYNGPCESAPKEQKVCLSASVPSLITPDDGVRKSLDSSPQSSMSYTGDRSACTQDNVSLSSMEEGVDHHDLAIAAKEVTYPLLGALPSLDVVVFVGEEAAQVLATVQLARSPPELNSADSASPTAKPAGRIKSVARRLTSSKPSTSRETSPGSGSKSPVPKPRNMRQRLSTGSASTYGLPFAISDTSSMKFSFRRCSSASAGCSSGLDVNGVTGDSGKTPTSGSDESSTLGGEPESSSDNDSMVSCPVRPASVCASSNLDYHEFNMRNAKSDSSLQHSLPHNDVQSPIFRGIVESMGAASKYAVENDDLPSRSKVCQLRGSRSQTSSGKDHRTGSRRGSLTSVRSAVPTMHTSSVGAGLMPCLNNAWDNESFDISLDLSGGSSMVHTVQFDWPSPGLHLASFVLYQHSTSTIGTWSEASEKSSTSTDANIKKPTEIVTVSHVDKFCTAASAGCMPGDAVLSINEHRMDNCSANDAWDILNSISSTSVRLLLMPIDGIQRLELEHRKQVMDTMLFHAQFSTWMLQNWEQSIQMGGAASMLQEVDLEDSSDSSDDEATM